MDSSKTADYSMKLSVVIPARDEAGSISSTVRALHETLAGARVPHEILVVDDGSRDVTGSVLNRLAADIAELRSIENPGPNGFGFAVRKGLEHHTGDAVAVVMADGSDLPEDVLRFYRRLAVGDVDCVFGSRFIAGGGGTGLPQI